MTVRPMILKLGMQHWGLRSYQAIANGDSWLTWTYFNKSRSNWVTKAFVWEKGKAVDFSEAVVAYDIKADLGTQLNELYKYQRLRSFTGLGPRSLRFSSFKIFSKILG